MNHRLTLVAAATGIFFSLAGCSTPQGIIDKSEPVRSQATVTRQAMPADSLQVTSSTRGTAASADAAAKAVQEQKEQVARRATKPWHGARLADVQSDEMLPAVFYQVQSLNFDDKASAGRVSLAVVAERLSRMTGVPVRIKADVYNSGPSSNGTSSPSGMMSPSAVPAAAPSAPAMVSGPPAGLPGMPPSLSAGGLPGIPGMPGMPGQLIASAIPGKAPSTSAPPSVGPSDTPAFRQPVTDVNSVEMRWNGTLANFLNHLTARLNLSWSYRDGTVVIERYQTETFELMAFGGTQDYKMSLTSSSSGSAGNSGTSGSASASLDMSETGKSQVLESLKKAIEAMVAGTGGSVVLNEGTGRFFVTAPRDVMTRVRDAIKTEDASLQRQAHIQFDVYSVLSNDNDEVGVDWNIVFKNLAGTMGATLKAPTTLTGGTGGAIGVNVLSNARFNGSSVVLDLLNQVGSSAQYRPVSMIAMNRQWARKTNLKSEGYVSETTPSTSSSAGSGSPGLKTSNVVTGDKFMVQPAIMDNGAILLKFGVSLSELLGMFDVTAGSGQTLQKVQTPVTSGADDQGTIRLEPGEVMVVTGLSRRVSTSDRRTLNEHAPVLFGGSRKDGFKREDFLIVVRATQM